MKKTDAVVLVVSEQRGSITYIKDENLIEIKKADRLLDQLKTDINY